MQIPGPPETGRRHEDIRIDTRLERLPWAAAGIAFLAFTTVGLAFATIFASGLYPSPFGPPYGPTTDVGDFFAANRQQVQVMSFAYAVGALALFAFVAYCAAMLATPGSGRRSPFPALALAGGTMAAGFWLLTALLLWVLAEPEVTRAPGVLQVVHDLAYLTGGPGHVLSLGLCIGAVSAALWTGDVLPRWVLWVGAAAAILSLLSVTALLWDPATFILPLGRGLSLLWILVTSLAILVVRSEPGGDIVREPLTGGPPAPHEGARG